MYIVRAFILVLIITFRCTVAISQTASADTGKIEVIQDSKIRDLVVKHIEINSRAKLKGYRIKIHSGSERAKASEVKAKFRERFPDVPAYGPIYDQPNYNIRVGDFRTKLEAYKALKEVQTIFPSAFIVVDEIEFPELDPHHP